MHLFKYQNRKFLKYQRKIIKKIENKKNVKEKK